MRKTQLSLWLLNALESGSTSTVGVMLPRSKYLGNFSKHNETRFANSTLSLAKFTGFAVAGEEAVARLLRLKSSNMSMRENIIQDRTSRSATIFGPMAEELSQTIKPFKDKTHNRDRILLASKSRMIAHVGTYIGCFHDFRKYLAPGERGNRLRLHKITLSNMFRSKWLSKGPFAFSSICVGFRSWPKPLVVGNSSAFRNPRA